MALPADVEYGQVKWSAVSAAADTADLDALPDAVPVTGTVTFTPSAKVLLAPAGSPPITVFATPMEYNLDSSGVLRDAEGRATITLVATDSAGLTPTGWTYTASYRLNGGLVRGSFSFELPAGTIVDLTTVAPVATAGGASIIQGPAGPPGGGIEWAPFTAYTAGQIVLNPSGQLVTANATFTSGDTYNSANWTLIKTTTAMMNARSVTEDKLNVPGEGTAGDVLTYDNAQAGQMKWAPPGAAGNTIAGLVAGATSSATANSTTLAAFVADATRGSALRIVTPGVYYFNGSMDCTNLTNPIRELYLGPGVELVQTRNTTSSASQAYGPYFRGAMESVGATTTLRYFTANANRGANTITLDSVTGIIGEGPDEPTGSARDMLTPGTVLYLCSDDFIHTGGKYRNSDLRRVVSVSGNTVTLEAPLYRNYTTANKALAVVVTLHPPVLVHGPGRIRHNSPWDTGTFYASLLRFEFCDRPIVAPGVNLGPGPGSGVDLHSCWGGRIEPNTEYLLSDDAIGNDADTWHPSNLIQQEHYGYGVAVGGATRDYFIGGTAHHVRHAFTTAASPDVKGIASISTQTGGNATNGGDPAYGTVAVRAWDTWQQAIDTHESGHDLTINLSALGPGTWDDTVEEAQQCSVNLRNAGVTLTGRVSGGAVAGVILFFASLSNPEYGVTTLQNLAIGPSPEAIRVNAGAGSKLRLRNVETSGCAMFLHAKGSIALDVSGEGNYADGTGITEGTSKAVIYADNSVPASAIDLGIDYVNYATPFRFNSSGLSQSNVRLRSTTDRRQIVIVYNGAWPTVRPLVPGGDVRWVSYTAGVTAPTIGIQGDTFEGVP